MPYRNLADYRDNARYQQCLGHRIAYWQEGHQGPQKDVILFIHGFPSAAWDWHHQWHALKHEYHLVALDLLGYGLSDKPHPHQYRLVEQADIIETLLQSLEIKGCHIFAHDYGDSVTQELLSRREENTLSFEIIDICFLNGGLFPEVHRPVLTQKLLKSALGPLLSRLLSQSSLKKNFDKIFGPQTKAGDEEIATLWRLMEINQGTRVVPALLRYLDERKVHASRWLDAMQRTDIPLYFINGTDDPISGQHMLDHYTSVIPSPRFTELPVGHYPQIEAPQEVTALFEAFIRENRSG